MEQGQTQRQVTRAIYDWPNQLNLTSVIPQSHLDNLRVASTVLEEYQIDKDSMSDWLKAMDRGIEMAKMGKQGVKSKPWNKAANIKYPLVANAALQFNARTYPAIVPSDDLVLSKVFGADKNGEKATRANRVAKFMNFDLKHRMQGWEEGIDRLLMMVPLAGCIARKVYWDQETQQKKVKNCIPGKIIINDNVVDHRSAPRISEELALYPYEVLQRQRAGIFTPGLVFRDSETNNDSQSLVHFIEQHTRIDIDGDGYPEPYIITVHKETQQIARIVANWTPKTTTFGEKEGQPTLISIYPRDYYVYYHFMPSPTGGFHSYGFGMLLGDINDTVDSIINLLFDSGHLSSLGAGFMATQNFTHRGGPLRPAPGEWKAVNALGSNLRDGMVPLQTAQPSPVLFELLGLLIEAGRELASNKDIVDASTNSQTPATTTLALIEQGLVLFTATYKRIYLGLNKEFKLLGEMNQSHEDVIVYQKFHDDPNVDWSDFNFDEMYDILPVADPKSVTSMQSLGRGQVLLDLANQGLVDKSAAANRIMEAAAIPDREELVPKPDPMQEQVAQIQLQHAMRMMDLESEQAAIEIMKRKAEIQKLVAQAEEIYAGEELDQMKLDLQERSERLDVMMRMIENATQQRNVTGVENQSDNQAGVRQLPQDSGTGEELVLQSLLGGDAIGSRLSGNS